MALAEFKTAEEINRLEVETTDSESVRKEQILSKLVVFLRDRWTKALRAKRPYEQAMLKSKRARKGEYEPAKLQAIKSLYGADYDPPFINITDMKCRAAISWIKDVLFQPGIVPYDLEPTPEPELPESIERDIASQVYMSVYSDFMDIAISSGQAFDVRVIQSKISEIVPEIKERINKVIKRNAKEAAERIKNKITDQLVEGKWPQSLDECIDDIATYKAGFLVGPLQRKEVVIKRTLNEVKGEWESKDEERIISVYERRSPFNIYPEPYATDIDKCWLFDKVSYTAKDLSDMIGIPSFDTEAIRRVLQRYRAGGLREWTTVDTEKSSIEEKDTTQEIETIDCLVYWGTASGEMLLEWGLNQDEVTDPTKEYYCSAYLIGDEVIKAIINPDPLGRNPYSKSSFVEDPDNFWGRGVPELIADIQNVCNAVARAIVHNVAYASGPQIGLNIDRLAPGVSKVSYPYKTWELTNSQMAEGSPIEFYQPMLVANQLTNIFDWGMRLADEYSGVPRYAHGETDVGGAGDTASGLSMLMTQAARGIKAVIKNIDNNIIIPSVERMYYFNLMYEDDIDLIGDIKVIAKGSSSMIAKEQQSIRRTEFMDKVASSPIYQQIVGTKGFTELLKEAAKSLEIDVDKIIQEEDKIKDILSPTSMNRQETLNSAGEPVSGQDFRLFQGAGQ